MLIKALCDYYDVLTEKGLLVPDAYTRQGISYIVELTPDGKIAGIIDHRKKIEYKEKGRDKEKHVPREETLPHRTQKPGIEGNIVEHRPLYLFGLNFVIDPDTKEASLKATDKTNKAAKSHAAFVRENEAFFEDLDDPECRAFLNFVRLWDPEQEINNELLLGLGKELKSAGFGFCLQGRPDQLLHDNPNVRRKWEKKYKASLEEGEKVISQCGILGEKLPIARIHENIKGIQGGQTSVCKLSCMKNPSEWSYGHDQSYNANISEDAMRRYVASLNYLLSSNMHKTVIGDLTIIHWAADGNDRCDDVFNSMMLSDTRKAEEVDATIKDIARDAKKGLFRKEKSYADNIDINTVFYVVGLKPNASRLEVRFVHRQSMGKLIDHLLQHQQDLRVRDSDHQVFLKSIEKELIRPQSKDKTNDSKTIAAIMVKVMEAAVNGAPYPAALFDTVIRRIKADSDNKGKNTYRITDTRIGILKACINRNDRIKGKEEELKMSLDTNNNNPAYLCGRLFAVLECIQYKASGGLLNRTIKDSYFSTAASKPAIVFPKLIKLAQHHMAKYEKSDFDDKEMRKIIDSLDGGFPDTLFLRDQGVFMIGYYQQKEYMFARIEEAKSKRGDNNQDSVNAENNLITVKEALKK